MRSRALTLLALGGTVLVGAMPAPVRRRDEREAAGGDPGADHGLHQGRALGGVLGRHRDQPHDLHPRRLLGAVCEPLVRGARRFRDRQRDLSARVGDRAVLDPGGRRSGAALQRPRLPELSSQGWPRPPAHGTGRRRGLDVPSPLHPAPDRGRARPDREPPGERDSRSDLRRPAAELRDSGPAARGPDGDRLPGDPGRTGGRRDGAPAKAR